MTEVAAVVAGALSALSLVALALPGRRSRWAGRRWAGKFGQRVCSWLAGFWQRRHLRRAVDAELPDVLEVLVGALRAGYGLLPALEVAAEQAGARRSVLGAELARLLRSVRLGRPLAGALRDLDARTGHPDLTIAATAIQLAHEVGGNLSDVLTVVRDTVLARQRLARQVRVLTAQARLSGWIVGLLPVGMLALLHTFNPDFTAVLWTTAAGRLLLAVAAGLTFLGVLVIQWLLREAAGQ